MCEFVHSNTIFQRELNIFTLLMSGYTNFLTARTSLRPLALKCLNCQGLNEFSLNTDINVCCSGLTCSYYSILHSHCTRANGLSTFFFSHRCCCNVLGSQNAHPSTETCISRTLFVLHVVIYSKTYYKCIVRFKLNRGNTDIFTHI